AGEVTGAAIVGGDDEQRPPGEAGLRLGQRGEQIPAQPGRERDRGPLAVARGVDAGRERCEGRVAFGYLEEGTERHRYSVSVSEPGYLRLPGALAVALRTP